MYLGKVVDVDIRAVERRHRQHVVGAEAHELLDCARPRALAFGAVGHGHDGPDGFERGRPRPGERVAQAWQECANERSGVRPYPDLLDERELVKSFVYFGRLCLTSYKTHHTHLVCGSPRQVAQQLGGLGAHVLVWILEGVSMAHNINS